PVTGQPGVVFGMLGSVLCLAEYTGTGWVLDTITTSYSYSVSPALAYDSSGIPHVVFRRNQPLWHSKRVGDTWEEEAIANYPPDWYPKDISIGVTGKDSIYITELRWGGATSASCVGFYTLEEAGWTYRVIDRGWLVFYSPEQYAYAEIWDVGPIDTYAYGFNLLYLYFFYNHGFYGPTHYWYYEVKDARGAVYSRWDNSEGCRWLNMAKGNFSWFRIGVTRVNDQWNLGISGVDLEELPTGEIIAGAGGNVAFYYNGSWWFDYIPGEGTSGRTAVLLTPGGNLFVAYRSSTTGRLHVAHKFFTVGTDEAQTESPSLIPGTVFLRGQEIRLDGEYDLAVYDLSGRALVSGRMASFSTAILLPGVYILDAKGLGKQAFLVK
ncbi:MAG: hypothetical protein ACPL68_00555, partial [Candidatus Hydrothermia bacterium]